MLAGLSFIIQQGCDITMHGRAVPCQAKARTRQTVAVVFMVPTSYIGHSWLVVGMSAAADDPVHSVLLMAVYSVSAPLMACHM